MLDESEERRGDPVAPRLLTEALGERSRIRKRARAIDDEQRPLADANVSRVAKERREVRCEATIGIGRVPLRDEDVVVAAVPASSPVLVCPARAERKVGLAARTHFVERSLEQAPPVEPVVVVAKAVDSVLARERRLVHPCLRN